MLERVPQPLAGRFLEVSKDSIDAAQIKSRLADLGGIVMSGSPADFEKLIVDETEKWAKVVKFSGAKAD